MTRKPHVVFLQEVIDQSWGPLIVARLGHVYNCHSSPNPQKKYYNAILIVKEGTHITGSLSVHPFPGSKKGRHLLQLPVRILGVKLDVMTTHLETKLKRMDERIRQLSEVFGMMDRSNRMSIFGGDLNLRDTEVISRDDMPEDAVDLWEACGRQREHQFTWDATVNDNISFVIPDHQPPQTLMFRFDRIYLNPGDDGALRPKSFELIGKDRLPGCGLYPSDHWGLWAEFQVKK
jgi:endonuclease/exonuclease/phosphatase family metal-dependent hydrolase